jgi:peptide/nickel transport system substrate-binding protein
MENRFGVKDFILFVLVGALLVVVVLAMFQYDRQWDELRAIRSRLDGQAQDLRNIQENLARGVAVNTTGGGTTRASGGDIAVVAPADPKTDPFTRVRAATTRPGYAKGGWLVDAFGNTVGKLSPLLTTDAYGSQVQSYVLESLADRDPDTLAWKPLLSRSWEITDNTKAYNEAVEKLKAAGKKEDEIAKDASVPDAIQVKFKMRDGLRFSDGTPLTAEDVVFTYAFTMNPEINSPRDKAYLSRIKNVEKTADDEVTFTFHEPYFEAFDLAATMGILAKHFYGQFKPEEYNNSVGYLFGSGPYRLEDPKSWKPGTLIQLVRNERYWGVQPAFDRLVWQEITNDVAHLQAFRNGDIDAFGAFPEQYKEMIADADLVARTQHFEYQNPVGGYRFVAWNQLRGGKPTFFADKRVRQAMTMLLDRERMIQEVALGYAKLATGPFNPASKQFNPDVKPWSHDVERAKAQLKDAGFQDRDGDGLIEDAGGTPFKFKLTYPGGNANYEKMALAMKDAYARAGIVLEPDPLDWAVMLERMTKKDFDAISLGWTAGIESDIYQMFHSSQSVAEGDNVISYQSPRLDELIMRARTTVDEARRMPLWREAHAVLHEDQPYTFLWFGKSLVFLDKRIHNVQLTGLGLNPRVEWFVPAGEQRVNR